VRATLPRQLNGFFLDCFLLAHNGPLSHAGQPDERAEERAVTGLLCRSGLGLVGSTPGPSGLFGGGQRTAA
jgi:hypothetical protein